MNLSKRFTSIPFNLYAFSLWWLKDRSIFCQFLNQENKNNVLKYLKKKKAKALFNVPGLVRGPRYRF